MSDRVNLQLFVDDAITRLEQLDGTTTWPPATELEIARAEKDVGRTLAEDHRALLRRTNGLSLASGSLRMFGVGDSVPVDLGWFNHADNWRWAWPGRPDLNELIWCGMHDTPSQLLGYARSELRGAVRPPIHSGGIDLPGFVKPERTLAEFLDGPWQRMVVNVRQDPIVWQMINAFGPIGMDQAVVPGPQYFWPPYDETREHEGAIVLPLRQAMINFHDLLASAEQIEARADFETLVIVGVSTEPDEHGRPRLQWQASPKPSA